MKTISVLSRKGGSGKTTVSVSLAVAAQQAGLRTVLADVDPMRSAAVVLAGREDASSLLLETSAGKLRAVQEASRRQGCELLIIDTPPAPEGDVLKAIEISDLCVAVSRPSALDMAAIAETLELISRRRRPGLVVLNQCPPQRNGAEAALTRDAVETLEFSGLPVAKAKLRSRVAYQHASSQNRGVTEWGPASDAAVDILRLLGEIGDRLLPQSYSFGERPQRQTKPLTIGGTLVGSAPPSSHTPPMTVGQPLGDFWSRFADF